MKDYFAHGRFPEVGQKQKTERKKEEGERLNDGDKQARMAHASRLGQNMRNFQVFCSPAITPFYFKQLLGKCKLAVNEKI